MSKYSEFFAIAKELPRFGDTDRAALVFEVSGGRTSSLSQLRDGEMEAVMDVMRANLKRVLKDKGNRWNDSNVSNCRKLVIAAIGGYFRLVGTMHSLDTIKATACRHAGNRDFNTIPAAELRRIYNTFTAKQRDCHKAIRKARLHNSCNEN